MNQSTYDIRFALQRLLTGTQHYNGCPQNVERTDEYQCSCGLTRALVIAEAALENHQWRVVR